MSVCLHRHAIRGNNVPIWNFGHLNYFWCGSEGERVSTFREHNFGLSGFSHLRVPRVFSSVASLLDFIIFYFAVCRADAQPQPWKTSELGWFCRCVRHRKLCHFYLNCVHTEERVLLPLRDGCICLRIICMSLCMVWHSCVFFNLVSLKSNLKWCVVTYELFSNLCVETGAVQVDSVLG